MLRNHFKRLSCFILLFYWWPDHCLTAVHGCRLSATELFLSHLPESATTTASRHVRIISACFRSRLKTHLFRRFCNFCQACELTLVIVDTLIEYFYFTHFSWMHGHFDGERSIGFGVAMGWFSDLRFHSPCDTLALRCVTEELKKRKLNWKKKPFFLPRINGQWRHAALFAAIVAQCLSNYFRLSLLNDRVIALLSLTSQTPMKIRWVE